MNAPTLDPAIGKNQVGTEVRTEEEGGSKSSSSNDRAIGHGAPEVIGIEGERTVEEIEESKKGWFAYFKTKDFYIVLLLGYVCHLSRLKRPDNSNLSLPLQISSSSNH